ncbi:hypothetical protein QUG48_23260, partial [Enterobacter hormaechei]|uniref:hypothetical protein n=1 Tax=Enterobacter hormaechei TaxID=158836 RepID=UPI0025A0B851
CSIPFKNVPDNTPALFFMKIRPVAGRWLSGVRAGKLKCTQDVIPFSPVKCWNMDRFMNTPTTDK